MLTKNLFSPTLEVILRIRPICDWPASVDYEAAIGRINENLLHQCSHVDSFYMHCGGTNYRSLLQKSLLEKPAGRFPNSAIPSPSFHLEERYADG